MKEHLPVKFRVFHFSLAHDFDQLFFGILIDGDMLFAGEADGGEREVLLMAGDAILMAGMIHEGFFRFQGGELERQYGAGDCGVKRWLIQAGGMA